MKNLHTIKVASIMFGIGFACLLSSCDKNDELTPDSQSVGSSTNVLAGSMKEIKVVDGILKFESKEQFKSVMEDLQKSKITNRFDNLQGFESMSEVLSNLDKSTLETMSKSHSVGDYSDLVYIRETGEYDRIVPITRDKTFASILNKDGMVQIGDEFFKVTKDKNFMVKGNLSKEEKQTFDNSPQTFANVKSQKKDEEVISNYSSSTGKKSARAKSDRYYNHDGNTYRFISGHNECNFWGIYSYVSAFAIHEELSSFLWWSWWNNTDAPAIYLYVIGNILDPNGFPHTINDYVSSSNSNNAYWSQSSWFSGGGWSWTNSSIQGWGVGRNGGWYYFTEE